MDRPSSSSSSSRNSTENHRTTSGIGQSILCPSVEEMLQSIFSDTDPTKTKNSHSDPIKKRRTSTTTTSCSNSKSTKIHTRRKSCNDDNKKTTKLLYINDTTTTTTVEMAPLENTVENHEDESNSTKTFYIDLTDDDNILDDIKMETAMISTASQTETFDLENSDSITKSTSETISRTSSCETQILPLESPQIPVTATSSVETIQPHHQQTNPNILVKNFELAQILYHYIEFYLEFYKLYEQFNQMVTEYASFFGITDHFSNLNEYFDSIISKCAATFMMKISDINVYEFNMNVVIKTLQDMFQEKSDKYIAYSTLYDIIFKLSSVPADLDSTMTFFHSLREMCDVREECAQFTAEQLQMLKFQIEMYHKLDNNLKLLLLNNKE